MAVDGVTQTLANPSTILPNSYPDGPSVNGQYLGFDNSGTAVPLTPGLHQVKLTYKPVLTTAATPTIRFSWAAQQADIDAAVQAAKNANQAVVFVDDANTTTTAGTVGSLGPNQDKLIQAVADANPHTTVVLNTNAAVLMPWLGSVRSVLEMWYPGQEGGGATADLLYGNANPSGHLPITFPASSAATPFGGHPERSTGVNGQITWSEGLDMGYRWYVDNDVEPAFAFGSGLSYSTFAYSGLKVARTADSGLDVTVKVTNTSGTDGTAVPQVYVGPLARPAGPHPADRPPARAVRPRRPRSRGVAHQHDAHHRARALVVGHPQPELAARNRLTHDLRRIVLGVASVDGEGRRTRHSAGTVGSDGPPHPGRGQGRVPHLHGQVRESWRGVAASPSSSLAGYDVLVDGTTVASVPVGTRSATIPGLTAGAHKIAVRAMPSDDAVDGGAVTSALAVRRDGSGGTGRQGRRSPKKVRPASSTRLLRARVTDRSGSGSRLGGREGHRAACRWLVLLHGQGLEEGAVPEGRRAVGLAPCGRRSREPPGRRRSRGSGQAPCDSR